MAQIYFRTTTGRQETHIDRVGNYLLWYAKNIGLTKSRTLYLQEAVAGEDAFSAGDLQSQGVRSTGSFDVQTRGRSFVPFAGNHWKTTAEGMERLIRADRIVVARNTIRYKRLRSDFGWRALNDVWFDTSGGAGQEKIYVVQTSRKIVERCILMATDPGDLVIDPTCGSGTTAISAEHWGRRWITIDASRVALSLARQRIIDRAISVLGAQGLS